MVRYYCPKCWSDFGEDISPCPNCGLRIHQFWRSRDRIEKLIIALHHPEPETVLRAAWLLGESRDSRAVGPLIQLIRETDDVYAMVAAVEALGQIGNEEAMRFLEVLPSHSAKMVRDKALEILHRGDDNPPPGKTDGKQKGP